MLLEASTLLDGVTVTARRSVVENHLGKKVLRLGQELTAKGSNALEVLEMVPSVTITGSNGSVGTIFSSGIRGLGLAGPSGRRLWGGFGWFKLKLIVASPPAKKRTYSTIFWPTIKPVEATDMF